ncbi:tRNA (adenosine(37)-N6)-threonylcarbamoyltransferase complex dimerization subunit type 1 TsaB [Corynebacterium uterequi]|uniref:tRNA threonylcarbamoyl adenosine modification protein n=1 Tax=Corynebacterium uterequi TaxID=1072256 RepID=A0A0G3HAQ5_9CORY|nr:tRNA (adenosine(37)-N6)-threonylcarbamoyltransferase complex dimerization subunit type 1 TsaB [Corynebacterium uterequi]AKK10436.1 tRNA threonylcarbamoyl adenosine modification protein [Corynebacterium uterequi]
MIALAIDTATSALVTGVYDTVTGRAVDRVIDGARGHNEQLMPTIAELLDAASLSVADIDAVVVGQGPGPFTGLRVGMASAAALGQALRVPVYGVSTLDALAHGTTGRVLVATDARRREVYWGLYDDARRVHGPEVSKPGELAATGVTSVIIPEKLRSALPAELAELPGGEPTLSAAALIAGVDYDATPAPLEPAYLRRPDAVPPAPAPRSPAIPVVPGIPQ